MCVSRKMSTLPNCLKSTSTSTSRSVFMVFHGFRLGCHGSMSVFMVFLGFKKFGLGKKVWVSEILISAKSFGFVFGSFGIENKKTEWQEDDQNKIKDKEIIVCC